MARKIRPKTEEGNVFRERDSEEQPDNPGLPPLVPEFQVVGSAVTPPDPDPPADAPPPPQAAAKYRVRNGGKILHRGVLTILRPGKVLDEGLYDIPQIRQQGIILDREK